MLVLSPLPSGQVHSKVNIFDVTYAFPLKTLEFWKEKNDNINGAVDIGRDHIGDIPILGTVWTIYKILRK